MYGIPGGSYFYQGPGVPKSPEEKPIKALPVCAPGTVYDEESDSCVPEVEPDEPTQSGSNNNLDGIGGTEMSTPYVEKGWRVQATEQLDWSNPEDFDAYMKELSKPQEKVSGLAKGIGVGVPLWGAALFVGQKMERKATINKIKAMENIANLIGDSVRAASAVKAGEYYKSSLNESQREYADTQNGEGYTITLVNQIMGKGFLDDVEGTRGNGFHSVADLQNMPQYKKDELKAAIEANNKELQAKSATKERRLKITTDAEAKRQAVAAESNRVSLGQGSAAEVQKSRDRADKSKKATQAAYASAKSKGLNVNTSSGTSAQKREAVNNLKSETIKAGGTWASAGRAKGGLMKKSKKK